MGTKRTFDFTNTKDRSEVNPVHQPSGDYRGKIVKYEEKDSKSGNSMVVYLIQDADRASATYPYNCVVEKADQLWKLRNILIAAGLQVPKKKIAVDPERIVGKEIGMTLEDDEYEGKMKSVIVSVFPASDLPNDDDEPPAAKRKPAATKPAAEEEEEEDLEELDIDDL